MRASRLASALRSVASEDVSTASFAFHRREFSLALVVCGDRVHCAGRRLFMGWECLHSGYSRRKVSDRTEQFFGCECNGDFSPTFLENLDEVIV